MKKEPTVDRALKELRELFTGHFSFKVTECESGGCTPYRYEVSLACPEQSFHGPTLTGVLDQVKAWRQEQS